MINRKTVAEKLTAYLYHTIDLATLVDWAEQAMMEEEFHQDDLELIRDIVSRIGVADVRSFGLTWEECEQYLKRLGYAVHVEVEAI